MNKNIFIRNIKLLIESPVEFLWTFTYSNKKLVRIYPFDQKVYKTGLALKKQLEKTVPDINVYFIGSPVFKLPGQKDVDLLASINPKSIKKVLPLITQIMGPPAKVRRTFAEWHLTKNGCDVELILSDPKNNLFADPLKTVHFIKNNNTYLERYKKIKTTSNGLTMREYKRVRLEFFNDILKGHLHKKSTTVRNLKLFARKITYFICRVTDYITLQSKPKFLVFCYHGISDYGWDFDVSIHDFKEQIEYLRKKYSNRFLITFDDGYEDLYKYRNTIKELGIVPTIFVLTNPYRVNRKELDNNKKLLTEAQIKVLSRMGWEVGLHSATHPDLTTLDEEHLKKEITDAKKRLEAIIDKKVNYFAYPKGRYNDKVINIVKKSGFKGAYSMDSRLFEDNKDSFIIPRVGVMYTHSFTEFKSMFLRTSVLVRNFISNRLNLSI
jgi:peptidoglycan/xylan/chitin deacetylase (PgdA/CDA1 family)